MTERIEITEVKIERRIQNEFPELGMSYISVKVGTGSKRRVAERLKQLSQRISGAQALELRRQPVPLAYRTFFHHIGIDPDQKKTPIEEIMLNRLAVGGLKRSWPVQDAITLAIADTEAAVWAYDGDAVNGDLSLRLAGGGEHIGPARVSAGTILVSDEARPLSVLFGRDSDGVVASCGSKSVVACALRVAEVPQLVIEEALWIFQEAVNPSGG